MIVVEYLPSMLDTGLTDRIINKGSPMGSTWTADMKACGLVTQSMVILEIGRRNNRRPNWLLNLQMVHTSPCTRRTGHNRWRQLFYFYWHRHLCGPLPSIKVELSVGHLTNLLSLVANGWE